MKKKAIKMFQIEKMKSVILSQNHTFFFENIKKISKKNLKK